MLAKNNLVEQVPAKRETLGWYKPCSYSALSPSFLPAQKAIISPFFPHPAGTPKRDAVDQLGWGRKGALQAPPPCLPRGRGCRRCDPRTPVSPQRAAPLHMEVNRGQRRLRVPLVYVNSFGSHRCGSIIRYGGGCQEDEAGRAGPPLSQPSPLGNSGGQMAALKPGDKAGPGARGQAAGSCGVGKPVRRHHGTCHLCVRGHGRARGCPAMALFWRESVSLRRVLIPSSLSVTVHTEGGM